MLTELKISNFRIFDDEVTVRFRPITVLIGRNSSGKSSIIKFLLMLQQTAGSSGAQFLTTEGDRVNLGAFPELKNSLTRKRNLSFELTTKSETVQRSLALSRFLELSDDFDNSNLIYKAGVTVSYSRKTRMGRATYTLVDIKSGKSLLTTSKSILDDSTFWDQSLEFETSEDSFITDDNEQSSERVLESIVRRGESIIRNLAELDVISIPRYHINSIRHLSPVRDESQRVIVASPPPYDNVGQKGQFTLPQLQQVEAERGDRYEFVLQHLRSIASIDRVRFKTSSGYVSQVFGRNQTTGADVLMADFGFGVSQCLPVLVQGSIMPPYTSLMVEQPEAQLHPTAQLELGSFFADLWTRRQVGSIIETHSRNILLRLRRLIAKGELSREDVSVAYFTVDEDKGNMPIVKNLDIDEDGSMEAGLPMEFFSADIMEGLKIGARA